MRAHVHVLFWSAVALALCGCGAAEEQPLDAPEGPLDPNVLRFVMNNRVGEESFPCMTFERPELAGKTVRGFQWRPPAGANIQLHHANLYALFGPVPEGMNPCQMEATQLHTYAPGGDLFDLPPGVGYQIPEDLSLFAIGAHVLRFAEGNAQAAQVTLDIQDEPAEHTVGQFKGLAKVPTIQPHETISSTARCWIKDTVHVVGVWPHMHLAGVEFRGDVIRANGKREALIHLDPWDWHNQQIHRLDVDLHLGDKIETTCVWANPTPDPIFPGSQTSEEMCEQTFIGYPAEAARCEL